jgi:hypothetical protein
MIEQDFKSKDDILEYAARLIEDTDISDMRGIMSRRKRDREDSELRMLTSAEVRQRCASQIRAMKERPDLTPEATLRDIAENEGGYQGHAMILRDAWPLAWKGWVNIECRIRCNSNCVPPETEYWITLTDRGRKVLAAGQ